MKGIFKYVGPRVNRGRWLAGALTVALGATAGCDAGDELEPEPERPAPEVHKRGTGTGGFGAIRLNTARGGKYQLADFRRDGEFFEYPEDPGLNVRVAAVELGSDVYDLGADPIEIIQGNLVMQGAEVPEEYLLGARFYYEIETPTEFFTIEARITGLMYTSGPTGIVPLVNIEWEEPAFTSIFGKLGDDHVNDDDPDNDPQLCDAAIDANSWGVEEAKPMIPTNWDGSQPNDFSVESAAVLYQDIYISTQTGEVAEAENHAMFACLGSASGKAALWGFPGWVGEDGARGLSRFHQLEFAMREIRADYCADGNANTEDGTPLQARDRWTASFDIPTADNEVVWGLDGKAVCISKARLETTPLPFHCGSWEIPVCNAAHENMLDSGDAFAWTKKPTASPPPPAGPTNECTATSGQPGCNDPGIEACVCAGDSYCCNVAWDSICVNEVTAWSCDDEAACTPHYGTPGCGDPGIEACVCGADPYCCTYHWDSLCVNEVESLGCGVCG